ncbi:MAG: carboxypeptidase regulatory-like domain-containing protein, partial [Blastocatellia bacterium]
MKPLTPAMRLIALLFTALFILSAATAGFGQSSIATLSGTVADTTGAVIPGATVRATNIGTGVVTNNTSNEAGVYVFPSLQPGGYRITAERDGFKKATYNDVILELSARLTLNLALEIGAITDATIEINAALDTQLSIGTSSVGGLINGQKVQDLPLPGRNALGLVLTQPGLVGDNFAGSRIGALNVQRDGINVMDQRINSGVNSGIFNSVDVIDEVRVITSPADAEYGRGSGQVLLTTRSGTNQYRGSLFESHRNTVLNANTFFNNLNGVPRNSLIRNQFGGRLGGPIIRNKTFFFVSTEFQRQRTRNSTTPITYTATARQGIFRYYPGVQNANANGAVPVVDLNGNPVRPAGATGDLQSLTVLGRDPNRLAADSTGTIKRYIDAAPLPNNFRFGDGLNTGGYTWLRPASDDTDQFNIRIDHNFSDRHRVSFNYTKEKNFFLNGFLAQPFPNSPGGTSNNNDSFYSLTFTSTITNNLINEFRAGASRSRLRSYAPWELDAGKAFLPKVGQQLYTPVLLTVTDPVNQGNDPQGRISPFYQYADNLTWIRGRHAFKGGVEARFASTNGFNSFTVLPRANVGSGGAAITGVTAAAIPTLGQNEAGAQNLLNNLAGSITTIQQAFNATGGTSPAYLSGEGKQRTWQAREFAWFFKDDYKPRPSLTLNLGARYEYYGVPAEANGKTASLKNGTAGIFGIGGTSFADLYQPGRRNGALTEVMLVGRNSPNPDIPLYQPDLNNFAPFVGLSWSIPGLGKNKTVLRVGYGISYERNSLRMVDVVAGDQPGLRTVETFRSAGYLNLSNVAVPLTPSNQPLATVPLTDRLQTVRVFDTNLRTPYVQNWNFTIQREIFKNYTLDVRYLGSKGTKLIRGANINEVNIFENGVLDAFRAIQSGGESTLLDRMFNGYNLGNGVVNGGTVRAGTGLRNNSNTRGFFANNNVGAFASYLNNTNQLSGVAGGLLRNASLGETFIVPNAQFAGANLTGNFANSSYHALIIEMNKRFANGFTLQSNYTFSKALGEEEGSGQEM